MSAITSASSQRWYRRIAPVYDAICRPLYARARRRGIAELELVGGETVLDLCCGTGLNLPALAQQIGTAGQLVGVDFTPAMLRRAEQRRWQCPAPTTLLEMDARELNLADWEQRGLRRPHAVLCSFGLAVTPAWREVFARSWDLLAPGGRYVVVDTQAFPGRWRRALNPLAVPISNWLGHAELRRPTAALLDDGEARRSHLHLAGYVHVTAATKPVTPPGAPSGTP